MLNSRCEELSEHGAAKKPINGLVVNRSGARLTRVPFEASKANYYLVHPGIRLHQLNF